MTDKAKKSVEWANKYLKMLEDGLPCVPLEHSGHFGTFKTALKLLSAVLDEGGIIKPLLDDIPPKNIDEYLFGVRCGIEDRDIYDRYEAAEYGYNEAFDYVLSALNNTTPSEKIIQEFIKEVGDD